MSDVTGRQATLAKALILSHHNKGLRDWVEGLYLNDAEFRQAVDTLAQMLPIWIVGIASEAELAAQDRAARIAAAEAGPAVVVIDDGSSPGC